MNLRSVPEIYDEIIYICLNRILDTKKIIMLKKIIPFLILASNNLHAQNFKIETMNSIKDRKDKVNPVKVGNGFFDITSSGKLLLGYTATLEKVRYNSTLLSFDNNMTFIKETPLFEGKDVFGPFEPFLKRIANTPYVIYYNYNNDEKVIEIFAAMIDSANVSIFTPKKVLVIKQKNIGMFKMMSLFSNQNLVIESSPDNSKVLFISSTSEKNSFHWAVTDHNMNLIQSKNQSFDNVTSFLFNNAFIDNDGNFFVGYSYKTKNYFHGCLFSADKNGNARFKELSVNNTSASFVYALNDPSYTNKIKVIGIYSNDHYFLHGAFSGTVDKTTFEFTPGLIKEFPKKIIEKFDDDGYAKASKNKYGIFPEIHFDLVTLPDGTIIAVGEPIRYITVTTTENMLGQSVIGPALILIFQNQDIVATKISKRERVGSAKNIFIHKYGNKAVLFYHDIQSNLEKSLEEGKSVSYKELKKSLAVAAVINNDGKVNRHILEPNTDGKYSFEPTSIYVIDDNNLIFPLEKDKIGLTKIKTTYQYYILRISD